MLKNTLVLLALTISLAACSSTGNRYGTYDPADDALRNEPINPSNN